LAVPVQDWEIHFDILDDAVDLSIRISSQDHGVWELPREGGAGEVVGLTDVMAPARVFLADSRLVRLPTVKEMRLV
jgi:hypothetical protein